jgi:hypothetical protein
LTQVRRDRNGFAVIEDREVLVDVEHRAFHRLTLDPVDGLPRGDVGASERRREREAREQRDDGTLCDEKTCDHWYSMACEWLWIR